jgi:hypothetical protein
MGGSGCAACAHYGYNPSKAGSLYLLCGAVWGKVGISNVLGKRLTKHARGGVYGDVVLAVEFPDGRTPMGVEAELCGFIARRTTDRAPQGVDGYTESFPAQLLAEVEGEMQRLLDELPSSEWSVVVDLPPSAPNP